MNVVSHHSEQQLQQLADREPRADARQTSLRTVLMAQQGFTAPEVAICTGFSPQLGIARVGGPFTTAKDCPGWKPKWDAVASRH